MTVNPFHREKPPPKVRTTRDGKALKSIHGTPEIRLLSVPAERGYDPVAERETQVELYRLTLETRTSNRGRPYSRGTIGAYVEAATSLGKYLTSIEFPGGYETVLHTHINDYLTIYHEANGQGGTVTKLGNLRPFFKYLADEYEIDNAYLHPKRNVYLRGKESPNTLPDDFVIDLLKSTSGRSFADLRDNLIIRLFMVGPRNCEVEALRVEDLDLREGRVRFPPKKWADEPRWVPIPLETRQVAVKYLTARMAHKSRPARNGPLLLGQKRNGPMTKSGIYQMLKRRAEEAGYDPEGIYPHLFRHTAADKFLDSGGQEGDALHLFGWAEGSRSMLDRYARRHRAQRAIKHAEQLNFGAAPTPRKDGQ